MGKNGEKLRDQDRTENNKESKKKLTISTNFNIFKTEIKSKRFKIKVRYYKIVGFTVKDK